MPGRQAGFSHQEHCRTPRIRRFCMTLQRSSRVKTSSAASGKIHAMNGSDRRELDIRLLRILQLLLTERSVSRVAERLGQTQPAVSATLRQLREIFGDPLLVRSGNSLVPTVRAIEMAAAVEATLASFDQ